MKPTPWPDRFWAKVEKTDTCWLWRGAIQLGYGRFTPTPERYARPAHRLSWTLVHGPVPDGLCVCHKCDVRNCVNPEHLFLGTQKDNVADMLAKGRGNRKGQPRPNSKGARNHRARLTDDEADCVRVLLLSGADKNYIAKYFGVDWNVIHRISRDTAYKTLRTHMIVVDEAGAMMIRDTGKCPDYMRDQAANALEWCATDERKLVTGTKV
jgi:hypothetical protein